VIAGNAAMAKQFNPKGYPTNILYNPVGKQVLLKEGVIGRQEIDNVITQDETISKAN
jgi:hypothetical protein